MAEHKTSTAQDIELDELGPIYRAYKAACKKVDDWQAVADKFKTQLEEATVAKAGPWDAAVDKRTTYPTVNGTRIGSYTEYYAENFDKAKARENHPDVIDEFTTKKQKKTFRIT